MSDPNESTRIGASLQRVLAARGKHITDEEAHELAMGLIRLAELGALVPISNPALEPAATEAPTRTDEDKPMRSRHPRPRAYGLAGGSTTPECVSSVCESPSEAR